MEHKLSFDKIESFCGNVIPLRLLGGPAFGSEAITWCCEGDCVQLTVFPDFTDGVMLTLLAPGSAVVSAFLDGREYRCPVFVREMKKAVPGEALHYYVGDFHVHSCTSHKPEGIRTRTTEYPADLIRRWKQDGVLDFAVVSDHACLLNDREYYRGYADAEDAQPMDLVVFPGCEAEITPLETDRYGFVHKNAGEVVTVNAAGYAATDTWEEFYHRYAASPFAISCLAHPQTLGSSTPGMWNFCLDRNNTPRFRQMVKLVEMGNGRDIKANLINELIYSVALDYGFRVSPACNSDSHGSNYHLENYPGRTVLMATEKSKEAFMDAILCNRAYATASGNVRLFYIVNGIAAPADLPMSGLYRFHVELSGFREDPTTVPVKCQVISDYGICIRTIENFDAAGFDFTVESDTARYFFLRLLDSEGRKTWSCPVWTGRAMDAKKTEPLTPLDKSGFTAADELTGADASKLVNDDPEDSWFSEGTTCSILIDMKQTQEIAALGNYPRVLRIEQLMAAGIETSDAFSHFPYAYRLSTSCDGKTFEAKASGVFRVFGGETVIPFAPHMARYVRLEILSTTGFNSGREAYRDANIVLAELTVYQKG